MHSGATTSQLNKQLNPPHLQEPLFKSCFLTSSHNVFISHCVCFYFLLSVLNSFNRRFSRRLTSLRESWCERCSPWPVGNPPSEFSQKSRSPRRSRTDMCLQSMISLHPSCTESKYRPVSKMCANGSPLGVKFCHRLFVIVFLLRGFVGAYLWINSTYFMNSKEFCANVMCDICLFKIF